MIDRTLPAIRNFDRVSPWMATQAFSFTYLASYGHATVPARVQTSLSRAWDYDNLQTFPRIVDGRPAYVVAIWNSGSIKRVIIGIEGMSSFAQLRGEVGTINAVPAAGLVGSVQSSYEAHCNTIVAELVLNTAFMNAFTAPGCVLQVAGFSLGAAIAEVMAAKFQLAYPTQRVQLIKFASPKVGSSAWANSDRMVVDRANYYCMFDPINALPFGMVRTFATGGFTLWETMFFLANNRPLERYDMQFNEVPAGAWPRSEHTGEETYGMFMSAIMRSRQPMDETNWWWWHHRDQYRAMFCGLVSQTQHSWHERFRYLEYDDDNQWGQMYRPGTGYNDAMKVIADPAPAAVEVGSQVGGADGDEGAQVGGADDDQENQGRSLTQPRTFSNPAWRPRRSSRSPLSQR